MNGHFSTSTNLSVSSFFDEKHLDYFYLCQERCSENTYKLRNDLGVIGMQDRPKYLKIMKEIILRSICLFY